MIVCTTCNDTHRMSLEYRDVMCTHCPTPCQDCRAGGNGPYCETTPCPCRCHRPREHQAHDCNFRPDLGMGCINDRCPLHRAMRVLARNLRDASLLLRSFKLGDTYGFWTSDPYDSAEPAPWRPGCGRAAP